MIEPARRHQPQHQQWGLADGSKIKAKNRALTGGSRAEDGAADLPLNYMQGLGTFWSVVMGRGPLGSVGVGGTFVCLGITRAVLVAPPDLFVVSHTHERIKHHTSKATKHDTKHDR